MLLLHEVLKHMSIASFFYYISGFYWLVHHVMQIDAWGADGEVLQIQMPPERELLDLVLAGEKQLKSRIGARSSSICLYFCSLLLHCPQLIYIGLG